MKVITFAFLLAGRTGLSLELVISIPHVAEHNMPTFKNMPRFPRRIARYCPLDERRILVSVPE